MRWDKACAAAKGAHSFQIGTDADGVTWLGMEGKAFYSIEESIPLKADNLEALLAIPKEERGTRSIREMGTLDERFSVYRAENEADRLERMAEIGTTLTLLKTKDGMLTAIETKWLKAVQQKQGMAFYLRGKPAVCAVYDDMFCCAVLALADREVLEKLQEMAGEVARSPLLGTPEAE